MTHDELTKDQLNRWGKLHRPPQSWYESPEENPFEDDVMTHAELRAAAERIEQRFQDATGRPEDWMCYLEESEVFARAYLAGAITWRTDFDQCPRDGTEVLLIVEQRAGIPGKALVGHWVSGGYCIEDHPAIEAGWYFWNGTMFDLASKPTHWAEFIPPTKGSV